LGQKGIEMANRFSTYKRAGTKRVKSVSINTRPGGIRNPRPVRMTEAEMTRYREMAMHHKKEVEKAKPVAEKKETKEEFEARRKQFRTAQIIGLLKTNPNITYIAMRKILPTVTRKELEELVSSGTIKKYVLLTKKTVFGIN